MRNIQKMHKKKLIIEFNIKIFFINFLKKKKKKKKKKKRKNFFLIYNHFYIYLF